MSIYCTPPGYYKYTERRNKRQEEKKQMEKKSKKNTWKPTKYDDRYTLYVPVRSPLLYDEEKHLRLLPLTVQIMNGERTAQEYEAMAEALDEIAKDFRKRSDELADKG